jgi:hypothetical protein
MPSERPGIHVRGLLRIESRNRALASRVKGLLGSLDSGVAALIAQELEARPRRHRIDNRAVADRVLNRVMLHRVSG